MNQEIIRDMIITAFEGGIGYWARIESSSNKNIYDAVFEEGGYIEISDLECDSTMLTLKKIEEGIKIMKKEYPRFYKDMKDETYDAETADVFIQLSLYKEIVFG